LTVAAARGDASGLRDIVDEARASGLAEEEGSVLAGAEAQLALWLERPAEAAHSVDAALAGLDLLDGADSDRFMAPLCLQGIRAAADLAEQHRARGRPDELARALHRGEQLLERLRSVLAAPIQLPYVRALGITGEAEASRLHAQPNIHHWRQAVLAWEATGREYPLCWVQWRAAEAILAVRGPRPEAAALVHLAATTAKRLRLGPLEARLAELVARHSLEPEVAAASSSPSVLTR
jgi:hypothetical protein